MGKIKSFEIVFENNKSVFFPGDNVTGKCVLELRGGELKLNHIKMSMRGVAKVHWTESRSTGNRLGAHTEHFSSEIEYFSKKQLLYRNSGTLVIFKESAVAIETNRYLWLENTENGEFVLTDGIHEFSFCLQLPTSYVSCVYFTIFIKIFISGISTSFEGKYGNVRYWLKAEIEKPWSFNNKTKKAFTVIKKIDINKREYLIPVANSAEKSLCCWCCKSGPISLYARTDRKGYCPGESIAITASFENDSSRTVIPQAIFNQTQTFVAGGKTRCRKTKLSVITGVGIQPRKRGTWNSQLLKIPAVSPSIINCCLIKVDYNLRISLLINGGYNIFVDLPVVIGTVPLRRRSPVYNINQRNLAANHTFPELPPYTFDNSIPNERKLFKISFNQILNIFIIAPPSYAECISGSVDIRDEDEADIMGDTTFTPMYTYVNEYEYQPPPDYSEALADQSFVR
ncbi:arrestin domain-containing protein 3-like protein [Leptotrombidium deliense]|uniref:Arrestin domain-containing protein 3-like protein n=1 Tax=Leptotrombidium deliense TaxID=299467 RepID=A0A443S7X2_9ACAR|nr:arrestin domain-containing protein 3-like protein [Leptotrombidium deliense]